MNHLPPAILQELEEVLRNFISEEPDFPLEELRAYRELVRRIVGNDETPTIDEERNAEEYILQILHVLNTRQLIAFYISLIKNRHVNDEFIEQANCVLEKEKYRIYYNENLDRWWLVDEGIEHIINMFESAVSLIQSEGLSNVASVLEEAETERQRGQWEITVWKCAKAVEGVARHCWRRITRPNPEPRNPPMLHSLIHQFTQNLGFLQNDEPLEKILTSIKDDFRNPTSHLDDNPDAARPAAIRNCDTEDDATIAYILSHLSIHLLLKKLQRTV